MRNPIKAQSKTVQWIWQNLTKTCTVSLPPIYCQYIGGSDCMLTAVTGRWRRTSARLEEQRRQKAATTSQRRMRRITSSISALFRRCSTAWLLRLAEPAHQCPCQHHLDHHHHHHHRHHRACTGFKALCVAAAWSVKKLGGRVGKIKIKKKSKKSDFFLI